MKLTSPLDGIQQAGVTETAAKSVIPCVYLRLVIAGSKDAARGGGWRDSSPPLAIRTLMFIFLVFHQHCKWRSGSLQNVLWQNHKQNRRQKVVNGGDLRLCWGALRWCRGAWHSILTNFTNLVFHISICGGFAHQTPPGRRDWSQGVATQMLSNQAAMKFRDLRNIEQLSSVLRGLYYHI